MKSVILPVAVAITAVLTLGAASFYVYSAICPCAATPGGFLLGAAADAPVDNWQFANDVPLCQLQIYDGIRPHAVNLNCMSTADGRLYLSCSVCQRKYWASRVGPDEQAVLRLDGVLYPVLVNRVEQPADMDRAWRARIDKLQVHGGGAYNPIPAPDAPRPDHWWTFEVTSRN